MQNLNTETDAILVKLYEEGNDEAFDVLLTRYQNAIFGYIYSMVKDREWANDLFQDTFVRVITRIRSHQYTENGKFASWVMRIAHNLMIDGTRQRKPLVEPADQQDKDRLFDKAGLMVGNVEMDYHNEQTFKTLAEMISRLPKPQQEIVQMRMYEQMSFKEIAAKLGCSINTALGRMRYAILNLRKMSATRDLTLMEVE